jgi:hypothetical protein
LKSVDNTFISPFILDAASLLEVAGSFFVSTKIRKNIYKA